MIDKISLSYNLDATLSLPNFAKRSSRKGYKRSHFVNLGVQTQSYLYSLLNFHTFLKTMNEFWKVNKLLGIVLETWKGSMVVKNSEECHNCCGWLAPSCNGWSSLRLLHHTIWSKLRPWGGAFPKEGANHFVVVGVRGLL